MNNLSFHLQKHERVEQNKPITNKRKEIIKIRTKANELENRMTIEKNQ